MKRKMTRIVPAPPRAKAKAQRRNPIMMLRTMLAALALAFAGLMIVSPPAFALDSQIERAIDAGQVGERIDGFLGFTNATNVDAALKRKVDEVNAKRRAHYAKLAAETGVTLEQVARVTGEKQLAKARPGTKIMDASGRWVTK